MLICTILLCGISIIAPFVGGGFGEVGAGILQTAVAACALWYMWSAKRKKNDFANDFQGRGHQQLPGWAPLLVFLALSSISLIFSKSIYDSLRQVSFFASCVLAYIVSAVVLRGRRLSGLCAAAFSFGAFALCLYAVRFQATMMGGGPQFWQALIGPEEVRLFGTFLNPNFFAGFLVLSIPVSMALFMICRGAGWGLITGVSVTVQCFALLLTGSKFAVLGLAAGTLLFVVLAVRSKAISARNWLRVGVLVIAMLPVLIPASHVMIKRVANASTGGAQSHSTLLRVYTWKSTLRMALAHPVLGVGPGAFRIAYPRYTTAGFTTHAHQGYLQIAAECGLPALVAFLIGIGCFAFAVVNTISRDKDSTIIPHSFSQSKSFSLDDLMPNSGWRLIACAIVAACVGSAVRNLVDSDWYVIGISLPFWILAGAAVGGIQTEDITVPLSRSGKKYRSQVPMNAEFLSEHGSHSARKSVLWVKLAATLICVLIIYFSLSFALGEIVASRYLSASDRFAVASRLSPLNPRYRRENAKALLASGAHKAEVYSAINSAIGLCRNDAENYFVRGRINQSYGNVSALQDFERSLDLNPHSTLIMMRLADAYAQIHQTAKSEKVLARLLSQENSPYETVKGVPELVDTTYAEVHSYFGVKTIASGRWTAALLHLTKAIARLERWRSQTKYILIARETGLLSSEEECRRLGVLRQCYSNLADVYYHLGKPDKALKALEKTVMK